MIDVADVPSATDQPVSSRGALDPTGPETGDPIPVAADVSPPTNPETPEATESGVSALAADALAVATPGEAESAAPGAAAGTSETSFAAPEATAPPPAPIPAAASVTLESTDGEFASAPSSGGADSSSRQQFGRDDGSANEVTSDPLQSPGHRFASRWRGALAFARDVFSRQLRRMASDDEAPTRRRAVRSSMFDLAAPGNGGPPASPQGEPDARPRPGSTTIPGPAQPADAASPEARSPDDEPRPFNE